MRYEMRPLEAWTDPVTPERHNSSRFKATWADTLEFLAAEIAKIGGREPVVIQVDVREGDIRQDGMLRANAKVGHPGVVVSFDSDFGPLRYATDAYEQDWSRAMPSWQANIRAIAKTLEALRAIDRWGVSKRGEQYTGWKALPSGGGVTFPSADDALRWMAEMDDADALPENARIIYRNLARQFHPDAGGDPDQWERLSAARLLLTSAGIL
jgi:hypothetical protein